MLKWTVYGVNGLGVRRDMPYRPTPKFCPRVVLLVLTHQDLILKLST